MKYEIIYDTDDCAGIVETFTGNRDELQEYIKELKEECDAYNIDANCIQ